MISRRYEKPAEPISLPFPSAGAITQLKTSTAEQIGARPVTGHCEAAESSVSLGRIVLASMPAQWAQVTSCPLRKGNLGRNYVLKSLDRT